MATVPVHLIAGYLGAGKTTSLTRLLAARPAGERVAVIVNDFGDAGIDARVIASDGSIRIAEIQGGCVCCTAPHEFTKALGLLLDEVRPERVFVETTGLARPADLVDTLRRGPHRDRVRVGPVIVIVDPLRLRRRPDALLREQIEAADVLVANRCDLAEDADLEHFDALAVSVWPPPVRVLRTTYGVLPDDVLDAGTRDRTHDHDHDHDHASTDGFVARSLRWDDVALFSAAKLRATLRRLVAVERVKGLFRTDEGVLLLEIAGGQVHERLAARRIASAVDVIAVTDDEADTALRQIREARIDPARVRGREGVTVVLPDGHERSLDRWAIEGLPGGVPDVGAVVPGRVGAAASMAALLDEVGVAATSVVFGADDGLVTAPAPVADVRQAWLVYALDGLPLPQSQGGPFRLLVPPDAGVTACANVKGVSRILLRT